MSYRFRFHSIPKKLTNALRNCQTLEDIARVEKEFSAKLSDSEDEGFFIHNLGIEIYDFGSDVDFDNEIRKRRECLFTSQELQSYVDEYDVYLCEKEDFELAINSYVNKIRKIYADLMEEDSLNKYDKRTQYERMKSHIDTYHNYWSSAHGSPINLSPNTESITTSWLYEHAVFELVRLFKTFDWECNDLLFVGW